MTTFLELIINGFTLLGALGGVGVFAWFVAKKTVDHKSKQWLQTHQSELNSSLETHKSSLAQELESHKASLGLETEKQRVILKRQEMMFEREVNAAQSFFNLYDRLYPQGGGPEPDWEYEIVPRIAEDFVNIEKNIASFLRDHEIEISAGAVELIERAKNEAREGSFIVGQEIQEETYQVGRLEPSKGVIESVGRYWKAITSAKKLIRTELKSGIL